MAKLLTLLGFLFLFYCLLPVGAATAKWQPTIKVAILKGSPRISLNGTNLTFKNNRGRVLYTHTSGKEVVILSRDKNIILNKKSFGSYLSAASRDGYIKINQRLYQGGVEVFGLPGNKLLIINTVGLEDYIKGLINSEISSKWPIEAVKAQAVAARTYALYRRDNPKDSRYDLESTVMDQVYGGKELEDSRARMAVNATRGEIIYYNGIAIEALYHSCCGGHTTSALAVWGRDKPYLKGGKCDYDTDCQHYFWQFSIPKEELGIILKKNGHMESYLKSITIMDRDISGRILRLRLNTTRGGKAISGKEFRESVGYDKIRSTNFEIYPDDKNYNFLGSGNGHGVGMCQWGTRGLAEKGHTYKEILRHYYSGTRVVKKY